MICKTCGKVIEEGADKCLNCGTTLEEMGVKPVKVELGKDKPNDDFQKKAQQFGGVIVKEKKASSLASVDPKKMSIVIILSMMVIFICVWQVFEHKVSRYDGDGYSVTLPASMKEKKDHSFDYITPELSESFSNSTMEFSFIRYKASNFLPELNTNPTNDDIEGMSAYYAAETELLEFDSEFIDMLDENFAEKLKEYKCIEKTDDRLRFTYSEGMVADNYVDMRVKIVDKDIYQYSLMCSDEMKDRNSKKFEDIFNSLSIKR